MKAKILKGLSATTADVGEHLEPFGTLQHVAHLPHPGVVCKLQLGQAGLQYRRGDEVAVIPREELIALFEAAHPAFAAAPNGNTRPDEVDALGAPLQTSVPLQK